MNLEAYFIFVFILLAVYVILGNYLYLFKIVPALDVDHSGLPSTQLKHAQMYIDMLQEKGEHPWFLLYLKHIKIISILLAILLAPSFLHIFGII
jgi:hypothetical protein